jgi:hypothetical protein
MHALKSALVAVDSEGLLLSVGAALVLLSVALLLLLLELSRLPHAVSARAKQPATSAVRAVFFTASS